MKNQSTKKRSLTAHLLRAGVAGLLTSVAFGALATGCLDRPVSPARPNTTNIFVDRITVSVVDKIDLLFMIDNSISMADKQAILGAAIPQLVNRLITPQCVDSATGAVTADSSAGGCPAGSEPEFNAVEDIHIGVISSSLGGHGGTLCTPEHGANYWNVTQNDRGQLLSRTAVDPLAPDAPLGTVPTFGGLGFLSWDPAGSARNPGGAGGGIADPADLRANFTELVLGAGEQGCGYEASLEAWYRFLVDPDPPQDVAFDPTAGETVTVGTDEVLLTQRANFLRPDSLVAVIMMSDENDCSIIDHGIGYLVGDTNDGAMPRSTTACDTNPNDPCCLSCIQANYPSSCGDPLADPKCAAGAFHANVNSDDDRLNLRCYDQKRRFGLDLLYPTDRYVDALVNHEVMTRANVAVTNPLFATSDVYPDLAPRLDSSLIFLAGIVGVPWQDVATDESLADPTLMQYLTAADIAQRGYWDQILGDPAASPPVPPTDPFMLETSAQRTGTNPRTGVAIEASRPGAGGNPINGHEYEISRQSDLQYACIFPLAATRDCTTVAQGFGCDCRANNEVFNRPLCENTTQHYAKAYPGTRFLRVLKDYGLNSIVASICPKNPSCTNSADANCGYNPAVAAIIDRLKEALKGTCLPRELATDTAGFPLCQVVEVTQPSNGAPCTAGLPGRAPVDPDVARAIRNEMKDLELCGGATNPCDAFHLCSLLPAGETPDSATYLQCLNDETVAGATGYCYIDAMLQDSSGNPTPVGNPALVADCPATEKRLLRFVSPPDAVDPLPWPNSTVFVACQGVAFRTD